MQAAVFLRQRDLGSRDGENLQIGKQYFPPNIPPVGFSSIGSSAPHCADRSLLNPHSLIVKQH